MVRTMSAKLRRSFAQAAKIGSLARQAPLSLVAAALIQSVLLIGLTLTIALAAPILDPDTLQLFSAVTILTAAYAGYVVLSRLDVDRQTTAQGAFAPPQPRPTTAPARKLARSYACAPSDAEQLARLKARVSHELRTPLNAVIGFSEMMHHEVLGPVGNERYREYVAQIRRSAEHFQEATEKTLAVTELLASPPSRLREAINLVDIVELSLARFRDTTAATNPAWPVHIDVHIDAAVVVESDRGVLSNALQHLWSAGRILATVSHHNTTSTCSVTCEQTGFGHVDLRFQIDNCDPALLNADSELSPGAELSLLLARLGVEAAGGSLTFEVRSHRAWIAVVRLPLAAQRELQLN